MSERAYGSRFQRDSGDDDVLMALKITLPGDIANVEDVMFADDTFMLSR
ncbi:hypothetical protein O9993_06545 [Vibrio lentus]|nr:hypothetical protein [Vibrio lentus]